MSGFPGADQDPVGLQVNLIVIDPQAVVVLRVGEQVGFRLYDKSCLLQRSPYDMRFNPVQFPVVVIRSADVIRDAEDPAGFNPSLTWA